MSERDITWMIGGPQGGGINVAAETFAKACLRDGIRVFANIEYHSNIMGEHSYYRARLSETDRHSLLDQTDVLVALDEETLFGDVHAEFPGFPGHLHELVSNGGVIYDSAIKVDPSKIQRDDLRLCAVPYQDILRQALREFKREDQLSRFRVIQNTIAVAASLALLSADLETYCAVIREGFRGRRAETAEFNIKAATLAYQYVRETFGAKFPYSAAPLRRKLTDDQRPLLIRGMHATAMGKLKAGLHLQTYYPISPATDESVYLEAHQREFDLAVVQVEDEIAAINMAVGAAHAGVRVSTSTSGPGLSLMSEGLGFASMTEAAGLVVFLWQRGGPSTGLPTRQEQADLKFALQPGHGEFPHIVVAPGDVQQSFDDSFEAFNWADRYQMPVLVITDKYLSTAFVTMDELKTEGGKIDRGLYHQSNGHSNGDEPADFAYLRYAPGENGIISPRSIPGQEGGIYWTTTDEHDQRGHITEDAANRIYMMDKRMAKLPLALKEIPTDRKVLLHGPADADVTIVGWGSTKGSILDAVAEIKDVKMNYLQVRLLRPFPIEEVSAILGRARRTILVENNYVGQLGDLIREQTGITVQHRIVKYEGRPFSQEELVEALNKVLDTNAERVHVTHLSA